MRFESAEMFWMLHDCGVPAKHLVYNKVTHGDFVTGWTPRREGEVIPTSPHDSLPIRVIVKFKLCGG